MSLIVKNLETKKIYLFTKGADQVMIPRLKKNQKHQRIVVQHLDDFAKEGLRTLITCQKVLESFLLQEWMIH